MKYRHIILDRSCLPDDNPGLLEDLERGIGNLRSSGFSLIKTEEELTEEKQCQICFYKLAAETQIPPEQILYIGTSEIALREAEACGLSVGLALWRYEEVPHLKADFYFQNPEDFAYQITREVAPYQDKPWLSWAMELQFIAQAGLTYSRDPFDLERFERVREISAEMMALKTGFEPEYIKDVFCNETGFQTPKLDSRAAVFRDGKILLVKERSGKWSLPGGWVDVNQSVGSNTVKEAKEESGYDVVPLRLIAVQDRNAHNIPVYAYGVCKIFIQCGIIGGSFEENSETTEARFFAPDELPPLAEEKNTKDQVLLCFKAAETEYWTPYFD